MLDRFFLIFLFGGVGAVCRYLVSGFVIRRWPVFTFPLGTLVVNILGSLFFGLLFGLVEGRHFFGARYRMAVFVGFLGAFTTFSTFSYETFYLLEERLFGAAVFNIVSNVVFGVLSVWVGFRVGHLL